MKYLLFCIAAVTVLPAPSAIASPDDVSYPVAHGHEPVNKGLAPKFGEGTISLRGSTVHYSEPGQPQHDFSVACADLPGQIDFVEQRLTIWVSENPSLLNLFCEVSPKTPMARKADAAPPPVPIRAVYQGLMDGCRPFVVAKAEEERKRQEERIAKRAASFRDGILAALRAAEEPDPFASIRGDFDLSASDSRQWKTSLQLEGAEKCGLLKTPPPTPTSASAWTLACMFRTCGPLPSESRDGDFWSPPTLRREPPLPCFAGGDYEGMVRFLQSVLKIPYQPDERAVNINQVYFADPSKPASRLFVAKMNEAMIGISVVAVRSAGAPADFNTVPFPEVSTALPTESTVRDEVEKIRSGRYAPVPPAQRSTASAAGASGRTTMTVQNSTPYELSLFYDGPVSKKLTLAPGASQDLDLAPGTFRVAGRVSAANVLPFYGEETYAGSTRYSVEFYIKKE